MRVQWIMLSKYMQVDVSGRDRACSSNVWQVRYVVAGRLIMESSKEGMGVSMNNVLFLKHSLFETGVFAAAALDRHGHALPQAEGTCLVFSCAAGVITSHVTLADHTIALSF